jgi:multidrug resistance protein MdtO
MVLFTDTARPTRSALLRFLYEELAPRPGRLAAVARITGCCTLVVAIAMLYQIPLPGYMGYAVFIVSRDEAASTLLTGVVATLAFAVAVALSLLFYTLDASEPALRLPLMAASTFIAMFLVRTMPLGPVAFLAGFVLVLSQTLIDRIPNMEALTHFALWLWVVVAVPVAVTVLVNLALGEDPARLARRTSLRLLQALAASLRGDEIVALPRLRSDSVGLVELRERAGMLHRDLKGRAATDAMLIETLAELLSLRQMLPAGTPAEARLPLALACDDCAAAFARDGAPTAMRPLVPEPVLGALSAPARPVVVAMSQAFARLADGIAARRTPTAAAPEASAKSMFVADAFSNPGHARFALKTTIAVMASYVIYSGLDWPGISTSITTCFFVALGSLGETVHKLTLRLVGAVSGGLIGGLCIVYVLPEMEEIGQLCLLIAAVSAVGAWIATSSERLSYAGMQMAFAFFLGVLQGYGPSTDLTVLRDRVVGILLGNVVMSVVFSVLWPTSAIDRARASVATALRTLGELLADDARARPGPRLAVVRALGQARQFMSIAAFELRLLPARGWRNATGGVSLAALDRLAGATFVVVGQPTGPGEPTDARQRDRVLSDWLVASADRVAAGALIEAGAPAGSGGAAVALPADAPAPLRAAVEARGLLQAEIDNAVADRS